MPMFSRLRGEQDGESDEKSSLFKKFWFRLKSLSPKARRERKAMKKLLAERKEQEKKEIQVLDSIVEDIRYILDEDIVMARFMNELKETERKELEAQDLILQDMKRILDGEYIVECKVAKKVEMEAEVEEELDVQFALMEEQFNSNMEAFFSRGGVNRSEFQQKAMMLESRLERALDLMMDGEDEMTEEELAECHDVLGQCRIDKTSLTGELNVFDLLLA